jgi:hypothetical protein
VSRPQIGLKSLSTLCNNKQNIEKCVSQFFMENITKTHPHLANRYFKKKIINFLVVYLNFLVALVSSSFYDSLD